MIDIRRARLGDAAAIGAVHVTAWRSAYPSILPDDYLAGLSVPRMAVTYDRMIRRGAGVFVATADTAIIGFAAAAPGELAQAPRRALRARLGPRAGS